MELLTASRPPRCLELCQEEVSSQANAFANQFILLAHKIRRPWESISLLRQTSKCCSWTMAGIRPEHGNATTKEGARDAFSSLLLTGH